MPKAILTNYCELFGLGIYGKLRTYYTLHSINLKNQTDI